MYDVMLSCWAWAAASPNSRKMTLNSKILCKLLQKLNCSGMLVFHFPPFDFSLNNGIDIIFSKVAFSGLCRNGANVFDMSTTK